MLLNLLFEVFSSNTIRTWINLQNMASNPQTVSYKMSWKTDKESWNIDTFAEALKTQKSTNVRVYVQSQSKSFKDVSNNNTMNKRLLRHCLQQNWCKIQTWLRTEYVITTFKRELRNTLSSFTLPALWWKVPAQS